MDTIKQLKDELHAEYKITKAFFEVFPKGENAYAPHDKSMRLIDLCTHIAAIFSWPKIMLNTSDLDFADKQETVKITNKSQLGTQLDKNYKESVSVLDQATEKDLEPTWSISMKGQKLREWKKYGAIRHSLNQITHHRAQLGVYFRLLDIPLPGSYGPSADNQSF